MSNRIQKKQIDLIIAAPIEIINFASGAANSANVTTVITTALSTAARDGGSVPLQVSSDPETQGVIASGDTNRVEIQDTATKEKIDATDNNNEVYGRVSESGGVYTLSYFYLDAAGTETAYTFPATANIDFIFNYRYQLEKLPADFAISLQSTQVNQDPKTIGTKIKYEKLNVTATNTFSDLTETITASIELKLIINGVTYHSGAGEPVGLTGSTPSWTASAFGAQDAFDVNTSDTVYAYYPYV